MVYTVQMDLYIDDDEIYSDEDIRNIIEESMSVASASVDHIKVIEVMIENKRYSMMCKTSG